MPAWDILIASGIMYPRVLIEVALVHPPLLSLLALPIGTMFAANLTVIARMAWRRPQASEGQQEVEVSNPLRLSTALAFGLVFALVLVIVRVAQDYFGPAGVYAAAMLTGLTGVDAITLSMAELASLGQVPPDVAAVAIVLAALANTAAKAALVLVHGASPLRPPVLRGLGVVTAVGAMAGGLTLWLGRAVPCCAGRSAGARSLQIAMPAQMPVWRLV